MYCFEVSIFRAGCFSSTVVGSLLFRPKDKYSAIFDKNMIFFQLNCRIIQYLDTNWWIRIRIGTENLCGSTPQHTGTKIPIHLADPVAEKDKVESGGDAGENDEPQREIGAQFRDPDGVEGVLQLDAPLAHVEDEEAEAAEQNHWEVAPIGGQAVRLAHSYIWSLSQKAGIRDVFDPLDPGWVKNQDPDTGWTKRIIFQRA